MKKWGSLLLVILLLTACQSVPRQTGSPAPPPSSEGIKPTGYTLNRTDISFSAPGECFDLKVRLVPEDAEAEVIWTSSDPNIASVSWNGRVTAISGGMVTITAAIAGVGEQECVVRCQFADLATPTLEPTPEPSSIGIELDVGDGEHTFWVEVVDTGEEGSLEVNIYEKQGDTQPVQTLNCSSEISLPFCQSGLLAEDMDFDGDTDFGVLYSQAPNAHASFSYYIWNEKEETFVPDPYGLNELCSVGTPDMLPEEKAIRTFMRSNAGRSGEVRFYRYLPEGFTCVRKMDWEWHDDTDDTDFLVENYENGEMRVVYQESLPAEELDGYLWSDGFSNWWDLSYHGE